jgi:hypothetical protein
MEMGKWDLHGSGNWRGREGGANKKRETMNNLNTYRSKNKREKSIT